MEDLLSSELVDRSRQREAIEAWRALRPDRYEPFSSKWNALLMYFLLDMRSRGMNVERLVDAEVSKLFAFLLDVICWMVLVALLVY